MLIGICGKSGSGKSTLSKELLNHYPNGIYVEVDKIGHSALEVPKVKEELTKCFGNKIIKEDHINRKELGDIVFASRKEMEKLTKITWTYMSQQIDKLLNDNKDKVMILDWILLTNTKYFEMCDIKILLDVPYEIRKERAMKRDHITEEAFGLREQASPDYQKERFDYVLEETELEQMKRIVKSL